MATLGGRYLNRHRSQYEPIASPVTRREGCTWTTGANGADASTGGKITPSPDRVHNELKKSEETDPGTPGWSLADLKKALGRLGVAFEVRSGRGWGAVVHALDVEHLYVGLQGDSDRFPSGCSGEFDGDHAIGVHPASRVVNGLRQRWISDPICKTGRWEWEHIIRSYAIKLSASVRFGVFLKPVPLAAPAPVSTPAKPPVVSSTPRLKVVISGPTRLYQRAPGPSGTFIGTVSSATYVCTSSIVSGRRWYRIASGKRMGQAFRSSRYLKVTAI